MSIPSVFTSISINRRTYVRTSRHGHDRCRNEIAAESELRIAQLSQTDISWRLPQHLVPEIDCAVCWGCHLVLVSLQLSCAGAVTMCWGCHLVLGSLEMSCAGTVTLCWAA